MKVNPFGRGHEQLLPGSNLEEYRASLPLVISRFTGYRPPEAEPPYDPLPLPPFT